MRVTTEEQEKVINALFALADNDIDLVEDALDHAKDVEEAIKYILLKQRNHDQRNKTRT